MAQHEESDEVFNVLIVEDKIDDALIAQRMLSERTRMWTAEVVHTLSAARERLARGSVDVVLADLNLPDSKGLATLIQLRELVPSMPIVVFTGEDDQHLGIEAVRRGAQDCVFKRSWGSATLSRALRYALERCRTERPRESDAASVVFEHAPIGIAVINSNLQITEANLALAETMGFELEELQRVNLTALLHDDAIAFLQDVTELLADGLSRRHERTRFVRKQGEVLWMDVTAIAAQKTGPLVTSAVLIVQDVTEREMLTQERAEYLREIERLRK